MEKRIVATIMVEQAQDDFGRIEEGYFDLVFLRQQRSTDFSKELASMKTKKYRVSQESAGALLKWLQHNLARVNVFLDDSGMWCSIHRPPNMDQLTKSYYFYRRAQ